VATTPTGLEMSMGEKGAMKETLFRELMTSAGEALEHAQGKRVLHTTELPGPPQPMTAAEVKAVRAYVNASQAVFARYLNVSTKLVQAWEAGRRHPEGAALRLLRLGREHPQMVFAHAGGIARVPRAIGTAPDGGKPGRRAADPKRRRAASRD
jgi:putative transcriptional regulator